MYTSLMLFALSGTLVQANIPAAPPWLTDYALASRQGKELKRPLAVFIGAGANGWEKICKDGQLGEEARRVLQTGYVCLYIDTTTEAGKRLAEQFDIDGKGLVISDISGQKQAFRHAGSLSSAELERYLKKYSDPERVVATTETVANQQIARSPASYSAPYVPSVSGRNC